MNDTVIRKEFAQEGVLGEPGTITLLDSDGKVLSELDLTEEYPNGVLYFDIGVKGETAAERLQREVICYFNEMLHAIDQLDAIDEEKATAFLRECGLDVLFEE